MVGTDGVHPRPQLVRDEWVDLCGRWGFAHDDADRGLAHDWHTEPEPFDRAITVPFPPESRASGVHDPAEHPVVWYRREFEAPAAAEGERLLLHFGAVDYRARVWVNGSLAVTHEGGHTPFSCDVTDLLTAHGPQVLVVRAEDQMLDLAQPRGKQDWMPRPHGIWYHRTTGIWQPVWLERVPRTHVEELHWTPDVAGARVTLEVGLNRVPEHPVDLLVRLRRGKRVLAKQTVRVDAQRNVVDVGIPALRAGQHPQRLLWSPERPILLDAEVELRGGDRLRDTVRSYVGLRSVGTGDRRFLLNGRPYFVRAVLGQGYWPDSHLAAPDEDALRREVELIKELGFNAVRVHQKVEDPRFLYWCDTLGLLVWGEMANAYEPGPTAMERLTREWLDVVRRDRSHPCIVTWVPMNESWGIRDVAHDPAQQSYASALYHLTKAVDPTRPVLSNDGWEHTRSDIWTIHDYAPSGRLLTERYGDRGRLEATVADGRPAGRPVLVQPVERSDEPIMLTEFGGVRYAASEEGPPGWGYSVAGSAQEYDARLADLFGAVLDSTDLAGFCYTQLTDTEQEQNGLLTESRRPKIPVERIREIVRQPARATPFEARC